MKKEKDTTEYGTQEDRAAQRQLKFAQALDNLGQEETPAPKEKKHKWLTPLVLVISVGIGIFLIIQMSHSMGTQKKFKDVFGSVLPINLMWTLLVLFAIIVLNAVKYFITLQATTGKLHPLIAAKTSFVGKYYDNITPFAVGGQPAQIYYVHSKGFSGGLSSAIILITYFINNSMWTLVGLVSMACNADVFANVDNGTVIAVVGWVGLVINMSLPLFVLFFAIMPKFATKLTGGVVGLGHKLHIVKDKDKVMKRAQKVVRDFRSAFTIIAKSPIQLALLIIVCIVESVLIFSVPYFIIKMFNGMDVSQQNFATFFDVVALNCYSFFGASIVPTPGGSGAIEAICSIAFSNIAGDTLKWVLFTWRFAVFYIYIIIGAGITLFNFIRSLVRVRRAKKACAHAIGQEQPPQESAEQPLLTNLPAEQSVAVEPSERIVEVELDPAEQQNE